MRNQGFLNIALLIIVIVLGVLLFNCRRELADAQPGITTQSPCLPYSEQQFHSIRLEQFLQDISRYQNKIGAPASRELSLLGRKEDLKSSVQITFSLNVLKNFFAIIEKSAKENNVPKEKLALTWNYAIYEPKHLVNDIDYGKLHTLYGIPSIIEDKTGFAKPVDLQGFVSLSNKIQTIKDSLALSYPPDQVDEQLRTWAKGYPLSMIYSNMIDTPGFIQNQGQLCPPSCNLESQNLLDHAYGLYPNADYLN